MHLVDIINGSKELFEKGRRFLSDYGGGPADLINAWAAKSPELFSLASVIAGGVAAMYISSYTQSQIIKNLYTMPPNTLLARDMSGASLIFTFFTGAMAGMGAYIYASHEREFRTSVLEWRLWKEFEAKLRSAHSSASKNTGGFFARNWLLTGAIIGIAPYFVGAGFVMIEPWLSGQIPGINLPLDQYLAHTFNKTIEGIRSGSSYLNLQLLAGYACAFLHHNIGTLSRADLGWFMSKLTGKKSHLISALERLLTKPHSASLRYSLAMAYMSDAKGFDQGLLHLKAAVESEEKFASSGPSLISPYKEMLGNSASRISGGTATLPDYAVVASFYDFNGHPHKAEELIAESAAKFSRPEEYWVYTIYFHTTGNTAARNRYLEIVLPMLHADSERFRKEPLGEDSYHTVFVISHPLLRNDVVFKVSSDESELRFESERTAEARAILAGTGRFFAPEPLFVGEFGGRPTYVMTQLRGGTLYDFLLHGKATIDDAMAAWELTNMLHNGISPGVSRVGYVPVGAKLRSSLSKPYLGLPEKILSLLCSCDEAVEEALSGERRVFNTDGHPMNRLKSDGKLGVIDLEDKGVVPVTLELVSLLRWRHMDMLVGMENEMLKHAGIGEFPYLAGRLLKDLSFYSAWQSPEKPSMHPFAPEKIADARLAIAQIKDGYPLSYASHRGDFERTLEGLERLAELRHAA